MKNTVQRIIDKTIELFNDKGFANTRLKDIADDLGISPGNLTYHFPKKDDLVKRVYLYIIDKLEEQAQEYGSFPDFEAIDNMVVSSYEFGKKYRFFYLDTLEFARAYPEIAVLHQRNIETRISQIKNSLIFNLGKGNLQNTFPMETYERVAENMWAITALWHIRCEIQGGIQDSADVMGDAVWSLLIPYLTEKGHNELGKLARFQDREF